MKKLALLVGILSLFIASPALASGHMFKRYCERALQLDELNISNAELMEDFNICISKVETAFEAITTIQRFFIVEKPNVFSCLPEEIELIDKIKIVHGYLAKHTEELNSPITLLIFKAFAEAFPCTRTQPMQ